MFNEFNDLHDIANEADKIALHYYFKRNLSVKSKSDLSPVTQADTEIETMIRNAVHSRWPEMGILGEEFGTESGNGRVRLIVDPIDGTRNFIRGLPFFATLLAIEIDGDVVAGVVSAPASGERWWARRGISSFCHYRSHIGIDEAIQVSSVSMIEDSQMFHGSLYGSEAVTTPSSINHLLSKTTRQRGVGDYYLHMLVASGAGELGVDFGLKAWDKAALKAIVEGAGGVVTDLNGQFSLDTGEIISSNGLFHAQILDILKRA